MEGETTERSSSLLNADSSPVSPPLSSSTKEGLPLPLEGPSNEDSSYQIMLQRTGNVEKRFPVDRRKLERLILAPIHLQPPKRGRPLYKGQNSWSQKCPLFEAGKGDMNAEEFFQHVMDTTCTEILWPSKLKINAKSKKDPQVKVAGPPEAVNKARDMILEDLDTKNNRVTLKINIANGEHSHVIGREGSNIRKVHQDTQCHIHFPDSNRFPHGEKSDQVSITGSLPAVEIARVRARGLQPVVISLTLPLPGHMTLDPQSPDMVHISETYNVTINIKPHPPTLSMVVSVRGTMRLLDGLKLAVVKIVEYITGDYPSVTEVTLYAEIASSHQRTVMGMDGGNLQNIMHDTCTMIQFPDPHSRYRSSQITIIGTLENVFEARQRLIGCLPVALLFDVIDEWDQISSGYLGDLMQSLDIYISMKPKAKAHSQSIIIKSIEQNIDCVYEARQKILDLASTTIMPRPSSHTPPAIQPPSNKLETVDETKETTPPLETRPSPVIPLLEVYKPEPSTDQPQTHATEEHENESTGLLQSSLNRSFGGGGGGKVTVKSFLDYDKRKEKAEMARKSKIVPNVPRYPTDKWSGEFFSTSMPHAPRGPESNLGLSTFPKGLESLNKTGFKALMKQATFEREQLITHEQNIYQDIRDLSSLLVMLGLEKYEGNFAEEEVDFETFLTMSEEDLKEVGVATLGARRKLQIAISEIRKLRTEQQQQPTAGTTKSTRSLSLSAKKGGPPTTGPSFMGSLNQSSRTSNSGGIHLAPSYMSRSVRF